jgi:hypothetical protein
LRSISNWIHQGLSVAEAPEPSDAVFVLAGGRERKSYGLQLYSTGLAPLVLLSVGRFEIRRFRELAIPYPAGEPPIDLLAAAQAIPPAERHFFVAVDRAAVRFDRIACGRLGTLREIRALAARCSERPEISSLMIVSSAYHLRRVRMCCRALLPGRIRVTYVAVTDEPAASWRDLLLELVKLPAYAVVSLGLRLARTS